MERTSGSFIPRFIVYNAAGQTLVDSNTGAQFRQPAQDHQLGLHHPGHRHLLRAGAGLRTSNAPGSYQFRLDLGRGVQLEPYDFNFANNIDQQRQSR